MTPAQKFALRISEIRQRLNTITGLVGDAYDEAAQNEERSLIADLNTTETRYQTALRTEGDTQAAAAGMFGTGDGEAGERGKLLRETRMAEYLGAAAAGIGLMGRPAELNAALEVPLVGAGGGVAIPWEVLLTPEARQAERQAEQRAFTQTTGANSYDGGIMARPILQRLFGADIMGALGVRIDSVPAGRTEWPLITGGVAPDQAVEGTAAAAAVAAAFATETLKPKRLTGRYEYTHELAAQVPDLESALRRDLADADFSLNRMHVRSAPVARTTAGSLTLTDGEDALRMVAVLPETRLANEVLDEVRAGLLTGLSVEFTALAERELGGVRSIQRAFLNALAVVDFAAYTGATVQTRMAESHKRRRRRLWL